MTGKKLNYCDNGTVLQRLQGNRQLLALLVDAYLENLPVQLSGLTSATADLQGANVLRNMVYSLSNTFDLFDATDGTLALALVFSRVRANQPPVAQDVHALALEMINLGTHLQHLQKHYAKAALTH